MSKVRELLLAFRNRRSEELLNASDDSLSFDSFRTEVEKPIWEWEKESTLSSNINILPGVSQKLYKYTKILYRFYLHFRA